MKHQTLVQTWGTIARQLSFGIVLSSLWIGEATAVTFTPPPGGGVPSQATGGASRGMRFVPPPSRGAPTQTTGGASRGRFFVPASGSRAPRRGTVGGASRGTLFTPAPNRRAPRQAGSGASRLGTYLLNSFAAETTTPNALMALLPQSFYGTTLTDRPTILVYLPASTAKSAVFSLKDESGNTQYEMTVPVSGVAGIVPIKLPIAAPALEVGKNYQWFLALKVDERLTPSTPYVDGWIQRIEPSSQLAAALRQTDPLQQAAALGANGVWYDCVATLATLKTPQSDGAIAKSWSELLTSVGLQEIAQVAIVPLEK